MCRCLDVEWTMCGFCIHCEVSGWCFYLSSAACTDVNQLLGFDEVFVLISDGDVWKHPQISFFPFEQKTVISNIPQACCMWNCQLFFLKVMHCFVHTAHSGTQINHLCAWFFFFLFSMPPASSVFISKSFCEKREEHFLFCCVCQLFSGKSTEQTGTVLCWGSKHDREVCRLSRVNRTHNYHISSCDLVEMIL